MSTNPLPAEVQAQLGRLSASEKKRLAAIIVECCGQIEELYKIRTGAPPFEEWVPAIRRLTASLDQMGALVAVHPVLRSFDEEGADGALAGMHLLGGSREKTIP
jgi:hypothetical protein